VSPKGKADDSFGAIAEEYVARLEKEGRADTTIEKVKWLLDFVYPALGDRSITKIDGPSILKVLRQVEGRGRYESARRLRSTIGSVFRYAIMTARVQPDPAMALKGALIKPQVNSRAAITDPKAFGGLLRAIEAFDGQPGTAAALKLMALLFPRPGELRAAEWSEFDLGKAIWSIPAIARAADGPMERVRNILEISGLDPWLGKRFKRRREWRPRSHRWRLVPSSRPARPPAQGRACRLRHAPRALARRF
jgi:integrase